MEHQLEEGAITKSARTGLYLYRVKLSSDGFSH